MKGHIPASFLESLQSKIDIVSLIGERVPLKKRGHYFEARCPFHEEKTPSFHVNPSKQFYHCFGCQKSGDAIQFVVEVDALPFPEAVEQLASRLGLEVPYTRTLSASQDTKEDKQQVFEALSVAQRFYTAQWRAHPAAKQALAYLKNRGLTKAIIEQYGLGFAPPGWSHLIDCAETHGITKQNLEKAGLILPSEKGGFYDRFRHRIVFPIRDLQGRVIGYGGRALEDIQPKYLNSPETLLFHKGKQIYGLYEARQVAAKLDKLILVEGYLDVIALMQFNVPGAVATLGTALTSEQIQLLLRFTEELVICFDGDNAGREAAEKALTRVLPFLDGRKKIAFLLLPQEDPDTLIRSKGQAYFNGLLERRKLASDFLFDVLTKDVDLLPMENKVAVGMQARTLIEQIPNQLFKKMLYQRLGQLLGLDLNSQQPKKRQFPQTTIRKTTHILAKPTPVLLKALALLSFYPELVAHIPETTWLGQSDKPEVQCLVEMIRLLRENPHRKFLDLIQALASQYANMLIKSELEKIVDLIPVAGRQTELKGAYARIEEEVRKDLIADLQKRSKIEKLTNKEKSLLKELLTFF